MSQEKFLKTIPYDGKGGTIADKLDKIISLLSNSGSGSVANITGKIPFKFSISLEGYYLPSKIVCFNPYTAPGFDYSYLHPQTVPVSVVVKQDDGYLDSGSNSNPYEYYHLSITSFKVKLPWITQPNGHGVNEPYDTYIPFDFSARLVDGFSRPSFGIMLNTALPVYEDVTKMSNPLSTSYVFITDILNSKGESILDGYVNYFLKS